MTAITCAMFRRHAGALVDGEITGARQLELTRHLDECPSCSQEVRALEALGDTLRAAAGTPSLPAAIGGLASQVISRTRAESAESWWNVLVRAREDWVWALVGGGSVAATLTCTVLLSCLLAFGPRPAREDSLGALLSNLTSPAGFVFLDATPPGRSDQDPVPVQVADETPDASSFTAMAIPQLPDTDLVRALADTLTKNGRVVALDRMDPAARKYAESLLHQINVRLGGRAPIEGIAFDVHRVRLIASTNVIAKGL